MSVIAWDGSHIVADNQVTEGNVPKRTKKLFRIQRNGVIHGVGFVGMAGEGMDMVRWWREGADADEMPAYPETSLIVATRDFCISWDDGLAIPYTIQERYAAYGSGSYYADSALALGKTARQAVLHAIKHDIYCGQGTTTIKL